MVQPGAHSSSIAEPLSRSPAETQQPLHVQIMLYHGLRQVTLPLWASLEDTAHLHVLGSAREQTALAGEETTLASDSPQSSFSSSSKVSFSGRLIVTRPARGGRPSRDVPADGRLSSDNHVLAFVERELEEGQEEERREENARELRRIALDHSVVLSFASASSALLAHNWRLSLQRLNISHVCVVALDESCFDILSKLEPGSCVLRDSINDRIDDGVGDGSESAPLRSKIFDRIQLAK